MSFQPSEAACVDVRTAAHAMDRLRAAGRTLHFDPVPGRRCVRIELRDLEGTVVRTITPSQALAIGAGLDSP